MNIVFLDAKTIGDDIDLSGFDALGHVTKYDFTTTEQAPNRVKDADIIILNKVKVNQQTIGTAANLKLVCVVATGTDNLDKDYLAARGIAWRNVAGYSTNSVAQHTFSILLYLLEKSRYYDDYVKSGKYVNDTIFTHFDEHYHEIDGMTWGIIGLGAIGRRVAEIAKAFGAKVIYYSPSGSAPQKGYQQEDLNTLLTSSDIISIHAPLNEHTKNLINTAALNKMKPSCILINAGRGPIVSESDLAAALEGNTIAAAGLDVLSEEPMNAANPLRRITDSRKLYITPHIAWASVEARIRLMNIVLDQIKEFFAN
ncbi:MAG: D-2-hydroxyacid dehydrogenase [Lachnospiraceae bacterium]